MVLVDIYWQDKLSRKQDSTLVSQKTDETDMQLGRRVIEMHYGIMEPLSIKFNERIAKHPF